MNARCVGNDGAHMKRAIIAFAIILICMMTSHAQAEERKCFKELVIKNSEGPNGFGKLQRLLVIRTARDFLSAPARLP